MRQILFLLVLLLAFTGCKQKKQEPDSLLKASDLNDTTSFVTIEEGVKTVPVPKPSKKLNMSDIIEEFRYIPIESNDSSLLGQYRSAYIYKERIFIHDIETDKVCIFDMNGKYINKIGNKGQGPGEVTDVTSIAIDPFNDYLAVYDSFSYNIFYYTLDGEFLFSRKMPLHGNQNFAFITPDLVAFGVNKTTDNPQLEGLNHYNLIYTDSLLNVRGGTLEQGENYVGHYSAPSFSYNGSKVAYTAAYTPDLYEFEKESLVHKYTFDYSAFPDYLDVEKLQVLDSEDRADYFFSSTYLEPVVLFSDRFLLFETTSEQDQNCFYSYYDKQTGKSLSFHKDRTDVDNGFFFHQLLGCHKDDFIGYVSASSLMYIKEVYEANKMELDSGLASMVDSLVSDDNDVLVLFKLKPIL